MKILLINPPTPFVYSSFEAVAPKLPPLGLCYLASVLMAAGHTVKIIDCQVVKIPLQGLVEKALGFSPDIAGITASTISFNSACAMAEAIKKANPRIATILGGVHISALPEQSMLEAVHFDYGVYGEGEQTIIEVAARLDRGEDVDGVRGAIWRKGGEVIINDPRPPINELDSLPFPARHLLPSLRIYSPPISRMGKGLPTSVISSRGCPFGCTFCDQAVFGRSWRGHSATYVVAELTQLIERHGVGFATFEDDFFLMSKKRVEDICRLIIDRRLKIGWGCSVRPGSFDEEILTMMRRAGCFYIYIGIESGSDRILKMINKKLTREQVEESAHLAKRVGLRVIGSAIVGFPTETEAEVRETISYLMKLPLDNISFFLYTPYPNTALLNFAKQYGRISADWNSYSAHPRRPAYVPNTLSEDFLKGIQGRVYWKFFLRPRYILSHLRDLTKPNFVCRVALMLFARLKERLQR